MGRTYQSGTLQAHFEPRNQLRDCLSKKSQVQIQNEGRLSDGYEKKICLKHRAELVIGNQRESCFESIIYHPGNYALRRFREETGLPEEALGLAIEIGIYESIVLNLKRFGEQLKRKKEKLLEELGRIQKLK